MIVRKEIYIRLPIITAIKRVTTPEIALSQNIYDSFGDFYVSDY